MAMYVAVYIVRWIEQYSHTRIPHTPLHQCYQDNTKQSQQICINLFGYLGYAGRKGGHGNVVVSVVRLNLLV